MQVNSGLWLLVHTLVAEVLADFIYTLETTYNQALQIKLGSDTHVQILYPVQLMVGDERAGSMLHRQ